MSARKTSLSELCTLRDLGMAYRKAKVDLFYSTSIRRRELLSFESRLIENLKRLQKRLCAGKAPAVGGDTWTLVPKRMDLAGVDSDEALVESDAERRWHHLRGREKKPTAEFRLMEALPIEFHVFAALWIQKIGHKFEERLSEQVYGNRLRRDRQGDLNRLSLGSYQPYIHPYCKWRDDGMKAIRDALESDRSVIAITADVKSFFHRLDPRFMLDPEFVKRIDVELNEQEQLLHSLFINSLSDWALTTPIGDGLPVGLNASSLIANLSLFEFDLVMRTQVAPLYYGRYVDDIILVMEDGAKLENSGAVWDWLCQRSSGLLVKEEEAVGRTSSVHFRPPYLTDSTVEFASSKNKVFLLSGQSGKSLLTSIEQQIQTRSSEWHALPELPSESKRIEASLIAALHATGELADSLRKADQVSVRRAALALNLRDVEAYSRALPPEAWSVRRHAFLDAFIRNVFVLPTIFEYFNYVPRIVELASSCSDFEQLSRTIDALQRVLDELKGCDVLINADTQIGGGASKREIRKKFLEQVRSLVEQCIESSFRLPGSKQHLAMWSKHFAKSHALFPMVTPRVLWRRHQNYVRHDLAHRPLKQSLLPPEIHGGLRTSVTKKSLGGIPFSGAGELVDSAVLKASQLVAKLAEIPDGKKLPAGIMFPTRPPSVHELYILHQDAFTPDGAGEIAVCLLGVRGFTPESVLPVKEDSKRGSPIVIRSGTGTPDKVRVAVSSWKTDAGSWVAALCRGSDPDSTRLDRLNRLLTAVMSCRVKPHYLILPECSLPPSWFLGSAIKLHRKGISLISGVEYLHAKRRVVRNQTWAALSYDAVGFKAMVHYAQDKQRPAQHEEAELKRIAGRLLRPKSKWSEPPIIDHGGFLFSMLVCSELTNIEYRASLRGAIDALFVPEWNQDTESFNSLIESAALDVHAFVIQCNDRQYGDSRMRGPHKNAWERDIVRVKGGLDDYFVIGEIDVMALREFQSSHRSPAKPFKPVPDGFEISHRRRVLPRP